MTAETDDKQEETKVRGHKLPTNYFKTKLIGCTIVKGDMNESIWQNHVKNNFKTLIDMKGVVRKAISVEYDRRHVRLKSDDKGSTNLLIFRHRIKSIIHDYHSTKLNYGCYLYKISNSTYQLVAIESNRNSKLFVNLIRRYRKNPSSPTISVKSISPKSGRFSSSSRRSEGTKVNDNDNNNNEASFENENGNIEIIDIFSSESDQETSSEIDIVDILPPVPFRNHTVTNIEDD